MTDFIDSLAVNKDGWDRLAGHYRNATHLPSYGPLAPTEDELNLLSPISGAKILEIGCGVGQSLEWLGSRGAVELWALDLSARQVALAQHRLSGTPQPVRLFESPSPNLEEVVV
jgi:2-polyprenyl-3-methyl-5-hydroxy-6-metoxy-1,4-benzoquinol methylase